MSRVWIEKKSPSGLTATAQLHSCCLGKVMNLSYFRISDFTSFSNFGILGVLL